jgi:hypothetical protein
MPFRHDMSEIDSEVTDAQQRRDMNCDVTTSKVGCDVHLRRSTAVRTMAAGY